MRATKAFLMAAVILFFVAAANGQMTYITTLSATTMPSLDMANKPLETVLNELHAKVPGFHFVIFRDPIIPADYPILPAMKLEDVHIDQFLNLIGDEFPGVSIKYNIDNNGNAPPLIEINIKQDPTKPLPTTQAAIDPLIVRVFGLNDLIVERMTVNAAKKPSEKQTTDDILSLVMAAQEQLEPLHLPTIKIHQPTNTLIFKGTSEQAALLEQSLANLHPTSEDNQRTVNVQNQLMERYGDVARENEELKAQLRAFKTAATQPQK